MKTPSSTDPQAQAETKHTPLVVHILNTHFPMSWSNENLRERVIEFGEDVASQSANCQAELLAALKAISEIELAEGPGLSTWKDFAGKCIDIARAAIAKVQP